jgi:deazaflavin-dependent oxidoreductase (nitroreductase family)
LPTFGVIVHTGRRTGRVYRTPVNVFGRDGGFVIALTYGPDVEWLKNCLASGGCRLQTRGRWWELSEPRVYHDERRQAMPQPVRTFLGLLGVNDFADFEAHPS